jgi:hypothetical protein
MSDIREGHTPAGRHAITNNGNLTSAVIVERLSALRADLMKGQARLRELDEERGALRDQLLRIDGAITALTQLAEPTGAQASDVPQPVADDLDAPVRS